MKRLLVGVMSALLLAVPSLPVQAANLQNFTINNFDIRYELTRDEEKRSVLQTTETITARFPDFDQNHGIERAIPEMYDSHPVNLDIKSVKKADGSDWPYETRTENDNRILRIGDPDEYIRGEQTFIITYSQRDVTKSFSDTSDEFYWDTNGTDWNVPITNMNVTLTIDESLSKALTGKTACYEGYANSTQACELRQDGTTFSVKADNLDAGQNVSMAIGFQNGTFGEYEQTMWEKILTGYMALLFFTSIISVGLIIWLIIRATRWSERKHERGTIIAEYTPPKDVSLTTSATLLTAQGSVFSAQLLDYAVRGYLKINQTREKSLWKAAEYDVEIIRDIAELKAEEQELLTDIFDGKTTVGSKLSLKTLHNNMGLYGRVQDNDKKLKDLIRGEYGLRYKDESKSAWFKKAGWITIVVAVVLLSPGFLIVAMVAFVTSYVLWPLTDKGLALSRYLEGLKEYIKVAEADRIKMLQSPEGAEKIGTVDVKDGSQLVRLYEKVLPYAVLFGQEKEWAKRLGNLYETAGGNPAWYTSHSAFNAAAFSSAVSGFSSAAAYSSAASSSSGGSAGGGSSGGGGGGGGGGGW